jgi:hypothetical protein
MEEQKGSIEIGKGREGLGTKSFGRRGSARLSGMMSPSVLVTP